MNKILDRYLDKYFSRKINDLVKKHIERKLKRQVQITYDDIYEIFYVKVSTKSIELEDEILYASYRLSESPVYLMTLIKDGWTKLDMSFLEKESALIANYRRQDD